MTVLLDLLRRGLAWCRSIVHRLGTRTVLVARVVVARLRDRWHADTTYRRTLIAAVSAITATVLPHPAAAAAVGALLADHPMRHHRYLADSYDDEDEPYRPTRDPWAPRRLWDGLE